jgi:hypothetical protein
MSIIARNLQNPKLYGMAIAFGILLTFVTFRWFILIISLINIYLPYLIPGDLFADDGGHVFPTGNYTPWPLATPPDYTMAQLSGVSGGDPEASPVPWELIPQASLRNFPEPGDDSGSVERQPLSDYIEFLNDNLWRVEGISILGLFIIYISVYIWSISKMELYKGSSIPKFWKVSIILIVLCIVYLWGITIVHPLIRDVFRIEGILLRLVFHVYSYLTIILTCIAFTYGMKYI